MSRTAGAVALGMLALCGGIVGVPLFLACCGFRVQAAANELALLTSEPGTPRPFPAARSRRDFAAAMSRLKEGMSEQEVIAILGKPDDVRTQFDLGGNNPTGAMAIWGYGCDGHLTFPTLGCVYIGTDRRVQFIFGGNGNPPDPEMFPEEELRRLLRLIDKLPSCTDGSGYDPLRVIRPVNALVPLGKKKALAAIEEYVRVWPCPYRPGGEREDILLLLRVLFDVPEDPGYMPPIRVGLLIPQAPNDLRRLPRFPILLTDDIPFLLTWGCIMLGGADEPSESPVAYFRKHGRLRARPLTPPASPLSVLDRAYKSVSRAYSNELWDSRASDEKLMLMNQLLRLVDSVYDIRPGLHGMKFRPWGDPEPGWRQMVAEFAKLHIRWDAPKGLYTFRDGTFLPEQRKSHWRKVWKVDGLPGDATVVLHRVNERYVEVSFVWEGRKDRQPGPLRVKVHAPKQESKPLAEFSISSADATASNRASFTESTVVQLDEGGKVQAQVTTGGMTKVSPVYQP